MTTFNPVPPQRNVPPVTPTSNINPTAGSTPQKKGNPGAPPSYGKKKPWTPNLANTQKTTKFGAPKGSKWFNAATVTKPRVLSVSQLLARLRVQRQKKQDQQKRGGVTRSIKPIIPPKSLVIILKEKPEKALYNRRIIDYKHCGLLQRYIGLGGKILPRRQTRLTAKQQRYVAKTIKSARVMALLPFVSKEKSFYR